MKILFSIILSLFLLNSLSYPGNLTKMEAELFVQFLITNSDELSTFFNLPEVNRSKRLSITYQDVKFKELIANDIDPKIKQQILSKKLKYKYRVDSLHKNFSKLTITISKLNLKYEYFFKNSKLLSKPAYYSQNWNQIESNYFIFHVSNKSNINRFSINQLDLFVEKILNLLHVSESEIYNLRKNKIHYFLCKNETEIKTLTGFAARGIYNLAYDYIISTYNCHYHEICHLLINYKLKNLDLYTLPFLQEGFAVAYGGRGGKEPSVILETGKFLHESGFINYKMLLSKNDFAQFDASISYPVAGLYTKFLIDEYGIENFLSLYRKYSSPLDKIDDLNIDPKNLPSETKWKNYLNSFNQQLITIFNIDENNYPNNILNSKEIKINENESNYLIKISVSVGLISNVSIDKYKSSLFAELFPKHIYKGENYIITASENEISIYNLLTNNLSAKYAQGFSLSGQLVKKEDGYFTFVVPKSIFEKPVNNYSIKIIE